MNTMERELSIMTKKIELSFPRVCHMSILHWPRPSHIPHPTLSDDEITHPRRYHDGKTTISTPPLLKAPSHMSHPAPLLLGTLFSYNNRDDYKNTLHGMMGGLGRVGSGEVKLSMNHFSLKRFEKKQNLKAFNR